MFDLLGCSWVQLVSAVALLGNFGWRVGPSLALSLPGVLYGGEVHRVFLSPLVFADMGQTLYGLMLLYALRNLERQMGFKKFGGFVMMTYVGSIVLNLAIALLLSSSALADVLQPGPFYLAYSMLFLYFVHVPRLHPSKYTLLNFVVFSEKSLVYLLALHLSMCTGLESLIPSATGLALGALYYRFERLQTLRIPSWIDSVCNLLSGYMSRVFPTPPVVRIPPPSRQPASAPPAGRAAVAPPPEQSITALMGLGCDRPTAIRALQETNNNLDAAANLVLR